MSEHDYTLKRPWGCGIWRRTYNDNTEYSDRPFEGDVYEGHGSSVAVGDTLIMRGTHRRTPCHVRFQVKSIQHHKSERWTATLIPHSNFEVK